MFDILSYFGEFFSFFQISSFIFCVKNSLLVATVRHMLARLPVLLHCRRE